MSDITTYYGGSVLAMRGKDSVAIIGDKRLGQGSITGSNSHTRIHKISPRIFIGLPAFVPDCQMLQKKLMKNFNLFELNEGREMEPEEFTNMVSYILYSKRFSPYFTSPIIAGISRCGEPYISGMDQIGCISKPEDFVTAGTADTNLSGICEALYSPDLNSDELFVTAAQAFLNAVDRDALSGWGAECYIVSKERIVKKTVKARQD
jgi:20S proteasome subunit beta 3